MKPKIPYAFLFLAAYLLNRFIVYARHTLPGDSLRPALILFVSLGVIFLVTQRFIKDWHRANWLTVLVPIFLLVYQTTYRWIKHELPDLAIPIGVLLIPFLTVLFAALAGKRLWRSIPEPAAVTKFLTLVLVILLGMQVGQLAVEYPNFLVHRRGSAKTAISPLPQEIRLAGENRPDIFIIVLDGYARQDVLREIYAHDNSAFIEQLERRGFYVASQSHSNYVQTAYSIASLMNFDYVQPWQGTTDYYEYLVRPIQENRVFGMLKEIGFTTVSFEGVTSYTQIQTTDVFYTDVLPLNEFETFLLTDSLVELLSNVFHLGFSMPNHEDFRHQTIKHFDLLDKIPGAVTRPRITYLHLLLPHPPFVFDEEGNLREPGRPFNFSDGNEFGGSREEYRDGYRRQVIFVNRRVLQSIDSILEKSDTPPVILLMSDHGPGSMFRWDPADPGCLWERTGNLYALLLPDHHQEPILRPDLTPVNTFRIVFNTYFGTDLPLLEERTYFATWHYPEQLIDVTGNRDSRESCAPGDPLNPE